MPSRSRLDEEGTLVPSPLRSVPDDNACSPCGRPACEAAHVADIYALGVVLLEALTGRPPFVEPAPAPGGHGVDLASRPAPLMSKARAYATARERPARALVRDYEVDSGRPIAPALRAILARCLDPDPSRRYRRALELAEDLDRWRTDRRLAYADEPFWGEAVPRWLRRKRRRLAVAAVSLLAVGLAITALSLFGSNRMLERNSQADARNRQARLWDIPESRAFARPPRVNASLIAREPDEPGTLEAVRRALMEYEVLGPGDRPAAGDWRARNAVRYLDAADREDLEVWLMERAYLYGRAMENRPDSPDDWRRALEVLDRAGGCWLFRAWEPLRDRLVARLGTATAPPAKPPAPEWLEEHLLGFAAEWRSEVAPDPGAPAAPADGRRATLERALGHYDRMLAIRPNSFWGHYRAATAVYALGRHSEAAHHLERCLERRPGNTIVQAELAGCLFALRSYPEALQAYDRTLERAPGFAEFYRNRIYARLFSRQTAGLEDDLRRFETLSRVFPPELWGGAAAEGPPQAAGSAASVLRGLVDRRIGPGAGRGPLIEVSPDEIEARACIAELLLQAGQFPLAGAEVEKILLIRPDHIPSLMIRAELAIVARRFDAARADLGAVLAHLGLEDHVRDRTAALAPFFRVTELYLKASRPDEARRVAERTRDLAIRVRRDAGWAHYNLARVYATLGATEPDLIVESAKQLYRAFIAHPDFRRSYGEESPWFDPVRAQIDAALGRMEDPEAVRRRLASAMARPPARVGDR